MTIYESVYICGCVLNCEKYLKNVLKNIHKIGSLFHNYKVIIAYDKSYDNSYQILKDSMNTTVLINENKMSKYRTENISNARNSILQFIREDNNDQYKYFIMLDLDNVSDKSIHLHVLENYLVNNQDWDALSFNRKDYYDIWALSIYPFVTSCWHWGYKQMDSNYVVEIMKEYISDILKNMDKSKLLECYSAFNGFSIYRKDKFINCKYSNNIYKSHQLISNNDLYDNITELNKITGRNNSMYLNLFEDCEHRYFHMSAIKKNNAKIVISPLYLFNEFDDNENDKYDQIDETDCKYISSRGILKSCDVKSNTPISSINYLLNYNFNHLYDKASIYVCNYAIPYFSTVINHINNRFILVSGDSDCTIPFDLFKTNEDFEHFINNEKIIHWYSQNCVINHPKMSKIPIGLDYHTMSDKNTEWGDKINPYKQEECLLNIKNNSKPFWEREILCYSNFHLAKHMNDSKYGFDRCDAIKSIDKNLVFYQSKILTREETWLNQSKYAFVISPHGNGLDCHRTWEALLLGCIPIVKKSGISQLFEDLPVLEIDNWKDISADLLNETLNHFKNRELHFQFHYEKLTLEYWINKIKLDT